MFIIIAAALPLLATSGLKIEDVIAHENVQQGQDLTIEENLHGGKILVLSDGTLWEIAPQNLNISQTWILPVPLKIEKSANPTYPYLITNTNSKSAVLAHPLSANNKPQY